MCNESNNEIMVMDCFSLSYVLCIIKYGCSKLLRIFLIFFIGVCKKFFRVKDLLMNFYSLCSGV